ncbi:hypothetical protein K2X14_10205 [Acetobacter sp. TBRC 12305]|uniref:Phage neck terminator protein gp12-like domain-containing protein n=1 Tax=Acetobacter garciniae TaxID=2817435 RepID=A0A939KRS5_9PROT|nr:hypothetical protein [Acetobacter garciniae]MBO1326051.1 hypothetical protein [Acetobacter garciniae]MBX0345205.1 hypothetical protein [Acetobacter garciniae]
MSYALTPTQSQLYAAFRAWLVSVLPGGVQVVRGQQNRAAPPLCAFVTMLITGSERLATSGWRYTATTREVSEAVQISLQLGVFGPDAHDHAQAVAALWRDMQAVDFFTAQAMPITPLYVSHARQVPLSDGEHQYQACWMLDLDMQVTFSLSLEQDFATTLSAATVLADTPHPPEE